MKKKHVIKNHSVFKFSVGFNMWKVYVFFKDFGKIYDLMYF